jgi:hypothetical protein
MAYHAVFDSHPGSPVAVASSHLPNFDIQLQQNINGLLGRKKCEILDNIVEEEVEKLP